jgi:hypothetical protein
MVAFITHNSIFAIGPSYPKELSVTVTQSLTLFSIIYTYYTSHIFAILQMLKLKKPSQKSIISQYKFSVKSLIYKECTLQLAETHSQQKLHTDVMSGGEPFQCSSGSSGIPSSLMTSFPCQQTLTAVIRLWALKTGQRILSPASLSRSACSHRVVSHAVQIKLLGEQLLPITGMFVQRTVLCQQITCTSYGSIILYTGHKHQKEIQSNEFCTLDPPPPFPTHTHVHRITSLASVSDTSYYIYFNFCGSI